MNYDELNESGIIRVWYYKVWNKQPSKEIHYIPFSTIRDVDGPYVHRDILYASSSVTLYRYLDHQDRWVIASIYLWKEIQGSTGIEIPNKYRVPITSLSPEQQRAFIELKLRTQ